MSGRVFEPQNRYTLLLKTLRNDPQYRDEEPTAYSHTAGWKDYAAAGASGAAAGEVTLYAGPLAGGVAGGATHAFASHGLKGELPSAGEVVTSTVGGAVAGKVGEKVVGPLMNKVGVIGAKAFQIALGKFDYLFGRVSSSAHNAARSRQLSGLLDDPTNVIFSGSRKGADGVVRQFETREGILAGPNGVAKSAVDFEVLNDGTRKFSTMKIFGPSE